MTDKLVERLRNNTGWIDERRMRNEAADALEAQQARIVELEKLDSDAAKHVESVICMRTGFTGEPPYVGWRGLGLALSEALDERDALRDRIHALEEALRPFAEAANEVGVDEGSIWTVWEHPAAMSITLGDLRRAKQVLEGKE